ncbi:MAG: DUF1080 domain-containing protein [Gemmataceae bacterium]|nr:DUF1080 domain-containing protein [Gemmataceae bacterium]
MRPACLSLCWITLAVGAALAPSGRAGDDFTPEPGFVSLFNGKDLTGWRYYKEMLDGKTATADGRFTVVDGVIVANEGKGIKDLYTQKEFAKDFQLKLEFRAALKADSGVYIRGSQLQVRDFHRRGEQKQLKKFQTDGWNELDITVRAGQLEAIANGKKLTEKDVLEVVVKDGQPSASLNGKPLAVSNIQVSVGNLARCLCNGEFLENMKVPAKGGIGLQAESGKFEFRRIRVKELN